MQSVAECAYLRPWQPEMAGEIHRMRHRMEQTASPNNLKRGPGGLVDVEFIAQMLQLKHGAHIPKSGSPAPWMRLPRCTKSALCRMKI